MPHDNDQKTERTLGLSPAQIAGSALSAMSAAFVASWAGTTGTLIGAAVGSVVATIGASLYTSSLRRSSEAVRRAAAQVRQTSLLTGSLPRTVVDGPMRSRDRREGPDEPPATEVSGDPDETTPAGQGDLEQADDPGRKLPWGKVLLASLAVMLAALGGITAVEAITGRPISSWLGGNDSQGTTVGHVVGSDTSTKKDTGTGNSQNTGTDDATTPSQDAQPSSPAEPDPSIEPSQSPSQAPSEPVQPDASTAP
ncbi:MAG: hypothetical protein ABIR34_12405 [Marmoricola sp.]